MPRGTSLACATAVMWLCGCGLVLDLDSDGEGADAGPPDASAPPRRDASMVDADVGDADLPGTDAGIPLCEVFSDDFSVRGAEPDWSDWNDDFAAVYEDGNVLVIELSANVSADAYAGYVSTATYDISDGWAEVKAAQVTNTAATSEMFVTISDGVWNVLFGHRNGAMMCRRERDDGTMREDGPWAPFVQETDVYWRIRPEGGDFVCETAGRERSGWTEKGRQTVDIDATSAHLSLFAGTWQREEAPGVAHFDDARIMARCPAP